MLESRQHPWTIATATSGDRYAKEGATQSPVRATAVKIAPQAQRSSSAKRLQCVCASMRRPYFANVRSWLTPATVTMIWGARGERAPPQRGRQTQRYLRVRSRQLSVFPAPRIVSPELGLCIGFFRRYLPGYSEVSQLRCICQHCIKPDHRSRRMSRLRQRCRRA